ncbi:replication endonuclease [Chromobacterium haemolyticum]|nr:replication endonuclease [Chromobacterium haemolyticum]
MTPKMPELSHLPDSWALAKIGHFPRHLQRAVRRNWLRRRNRNLTGRKGVLDDGREAEANNYLRSWWAVSRSRRWSWAPAKANWWNTPRPKPARRRALHRDGASMEDLERFCSEHGIALPNADTDGGIKLRLACSLWWRRNLRRVNARKAEALSIALGLVHKRHALYASYDAVTRRREQKRRNRALLEALTAINELGEEFSLADVADAGMSNPRIRRAELMCRIAGFEHNRHWPGAGRRVHHPYRP